MADFFEKGQTFLDKAALNIQGSKAKYFIALTNGNEPDDIIVCFVINSEIRMELYKEGCNRAKGKYILKPKELSFVAKHSSVMLDYPAKYTVKELCENSIELFEKANDILCRQIKNCINFDNINPKFGDIIKECFKNKEA